MIWVTVETTPLVFVETKVEVIWGGAVRVGEPWRSVVVINTTDGKVVVGSGGRM